MKIEKLYTLSQFCDLLESSTVGQMTNILGKNYHRMIPITIFNYNKFLKQPLASGMFINPFDKPSSDSDKHDVECFNGAEFDVMFKAEYHDVQPSTVSNYYSIGGKNIACETAGNRLCVYSVTLHDLAEATNGELTLENVTI